MEKRASFRGSVEAPRWAGFIGALKEYAFLSDDLELTVVDVQKGLIREHILFQVQGTLAAVEKFRATLYESVKQWNKED